MNNLFGLSAVLLSGFLLSVSAQAFDPELRWRASISNDLRISLTDDDSPAVYRNDAAATLGLGATLVPHRLSFVGNIRFVWTGLSQDMPFAELTRRSGVDPWYIESDAAFMDVRDILPFLDIRVGRQIVQWGTADMFNPTNNLNALDLEDPLRFGDTIANQMIRLDFNPNGGDWIFTAVWVPVFRPAQLPQSALLAIGDPTSSFPFVDPSRRLEAEGLRNIYLRNQDNFDVMTPRVEAQMPSYSLKNTQAAIKAQWLVGAVDASLSYYVGRDSLPVATRSHSAQERSGRTNNGTPVMRVDTNVALYYPKKQVFGFDVAGELPFLDDMGFWFEGALTFPERVKMDFDVTQIVPTASVITDDVVDGTAYFKFTGGMDYSVNPFIFFSGQFIRGFPDEFGAHAIQNYWMAMMDLKLLQERITLRNVVIGEIPHEDTDIDLDTDKDGKVDSLAAGATNDGTIASFVYYPELIIKALSGLDVSIGAYLAFGHKESKFAQPAAGPSQVFLRASAVF